MSTPVASPVGETLNDASEDVKAILEVHSHLMRHTKEPYFINSRDSYRLMGPLLRAAVKLEKLERALSRRSLDDGAEPVAYINGQGGVLLTEAGEEWFKAIRATLAPVGSPAAPLYASRPTRNAGVVVKAPFTGSIPKHAKWCQPGDRQGKRMFIVRFDDQDRNDAVFEDEAEAREFYARATVSWNCYLFGAMPAHLETSPAQEAVTDDMVERFKAAYIAETGSTMWPTDQQFRSILTAALSSKGEE